LIPSFVLVEGIILSENKKNIPFSFLFSIPIADFYFYKILNKINFNEKKFVNACGLDVK